MTGLKKKKNRAAKRVLIALSKLNEWCCKFDELHKVARNNSKQSVYEKYCN